MDCKYRSSRRGYLVSSLRRFVDYGSGEVRGRETIKGSHRRDAGPGAGRGHADRRRAPQYFQYLIRVDGDRAESRSYWFHYSNDNPERRSVFDGFGHYEDELVRVDGDWLFSSRKIYNEGRDEWAYTGRGNPAW